VCLDFVTDSPVVKLEYIVRDFARKWLFFDLYINDRFVETAGGPREEAGGGTVEFAIPNNRAAGDGKLRRVTIYLPHLADIAVVHMELADGAVLEPAPMHRRNLLSLGDSITQGMNAHRPSSAYPVQDFCITA